MISIKKNTDTKKIEYKANPTTYSGYGSWGQSRLEDDKDIKEFLTFCYNKQEDEAIKLYDEKKLDYGKYLKLTIPDVEKIAKGESFNNSNTSYNYTYGALICLVVKLKCPKVYEHLIKAARTSFENKTSTNSYVSKIYATDTNYNKLAIVVIKQYNENPDEVNAELLKITVENIDILATTSSSGTDDDFLRILTRNKDIPFEYVEKTSKLVDNEFIITNESYSKGSESALKNVISNNRKDLIKLFLNRITVISKELFNMLDEEDKSFVESKNIQIEQYHRNRYGSFI